MQKGILKQPQPGIVTLEEVQRMVAEYEGKDPRKLPNLPARIIVSPKEALIKSSDAERYYRLIREGNSWKCGCQNSANECWHIQSLKRYLSRIAPVWLSDPPRFKALAEA